MLTGMGATNPKFSKRSRKPKKIEHCTIPKNLGRGNEKQKGFYLKGLTWLE